MGYFGLKHWKDSDNAADFVWSLKKTTEEQKKKLISSELKDDSNCFNTPGCVNVTLAIEGGELDVKILTAQHKIKIKSSLKSLIKTSSKKTEEWDNEGRLEHLFAYRRLLLLIK